MNDYQKGGVKALQTVVDYINNQIADIKMTDLQPNTPRQITQGGMLKAYNKILQKCLVKIISIKSKKEPE